ncbi:amidase signature enzyme [Sporormia fimetaria CBS 119925]|uniref:Amidase signature enzyme n=1 Tax=Sporormia fimetaria CBS 119925 TaxID=1340428 RepID=A0A6A6VML8_9PLEO|nr:amidase signature enzyme [Sporormia fimetaria CBS 119925]
MGLNAFTVFNPEVLEDAAASDARRAVGLSPRPLEGIPYTLKDSFKYDGLTVTNGSPALEGLQCSSDSAIAAKLRAAGAILIGKTNMPPMAAGGMQRGLYGRAESPYNSEYLTAAFSSGSSNGAATSLAASMAVFGMGSETVSSGRSPASNNALVAYTPSRGVLSCRGLWPLYVTCDTPVPYTRSMTDMLELLAVIAEPDEETKGDFWREQRYVKLPRPPKFHLPSLKDPYALRGRRIGVPKMYVGQKDSDPNAKPVIVNQEVVDLWETAKGDLEALGAEVVYTDFPLVTNYENDSKSGEANNVVGLPKGWNQAERGVLIAKAWDDFLIQNNDAKLAKAWDDFRIQNNDAKLSSLDKVDPTMLFPKPENYIPDKFLEVRNWIDYPGLPELCKEYKYTSIYYLDGLRHALRSLERQRKRDLEDWMDELKLDCIAFPANGDVGYADLEFDVDHAEHSLKNGVKYSNGNRAIRHLGVPTVSVPMGVMAGRKMPVNLTFAGKAYEDEKLLRYAYAYEQKSKRRVSPPLTPPLPTDVVVRNNNNRTTDVYANGAKFIPSNVPRVAGGLSFAGELSRAFNNDWFPSGEDWLGWDLLPRPPRLLMILTVRKSPSAPTSAQMLWIPRTMNETDRMEE